MTKMNEFPTVKGDRMSITSLVKDLHNLNPSARIRWKRIDPCIFSLVPIDQLVLPPDMYWNEKNGITNKHHTTSGVYITCAVYDWNEAPASAVEAGQKPPKREELPPTFFLHGMNKMAYLLKEKGLKIEDKKNPIGNRQFVVNDVLSIIEDEGYHRRAGEEFMFEMCWLPSLKGDEDGNPIIPVPDQLLDAGEFDCDGIARYQSEDKVMQAIALML